MFAPRASSRFSGVLFRQVLIWHALLGVFLIGLASGQNAASGQAPSSAQHPLPQMEPLVPARTSVTLESFIDSAIRQERHMTDLLRNFRPIVETYLQEERPDSRTGTSPKSDEYFLSRADLSGAAPTTQDFVDPERLKLAWKEKLHKNPRPFTAVSFAQPLFPDLGHFDRQNYSFDF